MDEKYLELLADYAARQIAAQRERKTREFREAERGAKRRASRAAVVARDARRSFAVSDAHKHALLLALGGRSAAEIAATRTETESESGEN